MPFVSTLRRSLGSAKGQISPPVLNPSISTRSGTERFLLEQFFYPRVAPGNRIADRELYALDCYRSNLRSECIGNVPSVPLGIFSLLSFLIETILIVDEVE